MFCQTLKSRVRTYTSAEKICSVNFTESITMHYNGANSYLFVNGIEIYKFKSKDSEIVAALLCLEKNPKDWLVDNMKKTELNGYVYEFSADTLDTHSYLTKKNNMT